MTEAYDTAVGAVLQKYLDDDWKPLGFFFTEVETGRNSAQYVQQRATRIISNSRAFPYFLEGRGFHVLTDHKPLTSAFKETAAPTLLY